MMEIWILVLFLAGEKIDVPGEFEVKGECIAAGKELVEEFKEQHPHSAGWFWCAKGRKS